MEIPTAVNRVLWFVLAGTAVTVAMDDGPEEHACLTFRFETKPFAGTRMCDSKMGMLRTSTTRIKIGDCVVWMILFLTDLS